MTECNHCGGCCDPVMLPYTQDEVVALAANGEVTKEHRDWVLGVLVPMPHKEVKTVAPWAFEGRYKTAIGMTTMEVQPFYYRCRWYDRTARRCTHYEDRPPECRRYPWMMGAPTGLETLPPMCSFNADIGQPVVLTAKPDHVHR